MSTYLIIGANSGIAKHLCREFAAHGHTLCLASNELDALNRLAIDLRERYRSEHQVLYFDAMDSDACGALIDDAERLVGELDGVVWVTGVMFEQADLAANTALLAKQHQINFTAAMLTLSVVANRFESRRRGVIAAFGSVAGMRARKKNYLYGTDKAALHFFLDGLRVRLDSSNVAVVCIRPGMVRTPMTADLPDGPLMADPVKVAKIVYDGIANRTPMVFAPGFWRLIMLIIRMIPFRVFKGMSF